VSVIEGAMDPTKVTGPMLVVNVTENDSRQEYGSSSLSDWPCFWELS